MIIRRVAPDEAEPLLAAVMAVEREAQIHPWTENAVRSSFGRNYRFYGMFDGAALAGYAVYDFAADEATLQNLAVARAYRGKGLGRELLGRTLGLLEAEIRPARILLEVRRSNVRAIRLYESAGFRRDGVRRNYYPAPGGTREDAVLMSRPAAAAGERPDR